MQMNDIIGEMQPSDYSSVGSSCGCGCGCGNLGGLGNVSIKNPAIKCNAYIMAGIVWFRMQEG